MPRTGRSRLASPASTPGPAPYTPAPLLLPQSLPQVREVYERITEKEVVPV